MISTYLFIFFCSTPIFFAHGLVICIFPIYNIVIMVVVKVVVVKWL